MHRRFQFSLRALLVMPVIVATFFAGEHYGRKRENYRLNRIQDLRDDLTYFSRHYEDRRIVSAEVRREWQETEAELRELLGIDR